MSTVSVNTLLDGLASARTTLERALADPDGKLLATETLLLTALDGGRELSPTRLAALVGVSRGRLSHIIDHLADLDLVVRRPDPVDHRAIRVGLTADGRLAAAQAARRLREAETRLEQLLGSAGVAMLHQQLESLRSLNGC